MKKVWILALALLAVLSCAACGGTDAPADDAAPAEDSAPVETPEAPEAPEEPAEPAEDAPALLLERTAGSVTVTGEDGAEISLQADLPLREGDVVQTADDGLAWLRVGDTKLWKLDGQSAAVFTGGETPTLEAQRGRVFFLAASAGDEAVQLAAGDMTVELRNACGWLDCDAVGGPRLFLMDGEAVCRVGTERLTARPGDTAQRMPESESGAQLDPGYFTQADVPEFARAEVDDATFSALPEGETAEPEIPEDPTVRTLPLTGQELSQFLSQSAGTPLTIQAGPDNNILEIEQYETVSDHLILDEGVTLVIPDGATLWVYGTLEVRGDVEVGGDLFVGEDALVQVGGQIRSTGSIWNGDVDKETDSSTVQNAKIVTGGGIVLNGGFMLSVGAVEGGVTQNGGNLEQIAGTIDQIN